MEDYNVECVGQSYPDKSNYVVIIGDRFYDNNKRPWESCYKIVENQMKQVERDKDLSTLKKTLQDKGFVKLRDKQYAIGAVLNP